MCFHLLRQSIRLLFLTPWIFKPRKMYSSAFLQALSLKPIIYHKAVNNCCVGLTFCALIHKKSQSVRYCYKSPSGTFLNDSLLPPPKGRCRMNSFPPSKCRLAWLSVCIRPKYFVHQLLFIPNHRHSSIKFSFFKTKKPHKKTVILSSKQAPICGGISIAIQHDDLEKTAQNSPKRCNRCEK